jgi:type-F conjugative transfer system pilin assembly protein TrbC
VVHGQTHPEINFDYPAIDPAQMSKMQRDIRALLAHRPSPSITHPNHLHSDPAPLIFLSFSMPEDDLRGLLGEAVKTGSPVVLRGMVENSMKRTVERLGALLDKDESSNTGPSPALATDPTLFERFKIDKVPAFVLPIVGVDTCTPVGCPIPDHLKLAGDVSLDYALDVMAREGTEATLAKRAADWKRKLEATP